MPRTRKIVAPVEPTSRVEKPPVEGFLGLQDDKLDLQRKKPSERQKAIDTIETGCKLFRATYGVSPELILVRAERRELLGDYPLPNGARFGIRRTVPADGCFFGMDTPENQRWESKPDEAQAAA